MAMLPLDDGRLHYVTLGSGPPMLMMHGGLGLDHSVLRPWLDPLGGSVELIFYDHLANGRSEYTGESDALTHQRWIDTADLLRRHLGHERLFLFGHSYGALLALEYALQHGERLDGLILCNVAPAMDYPDAVMANAQRKAPDPETFHAVIDLLSGPLARDAAWAEAFRRISPLYFHEHDPALHDPVLADVEFRALAANRSTFECLPRYDVSARLGEIDVPTLVISGADDWIMPPEHAGERVAEGLPDAEHVVMEKSGHWPFVEEREPFLAVTTGWLERAGVPVSERA